MTIGKPKAIPASRRHKQRRRPLTVFFRTQFREDRDDRHKDFNDVAASVGPEAVKAAIDAAAAPTEHDEEDDEEGDVRVQAKRPMP